MLRWLSHAMGDDATDIDAATTRPPKRGRGAPRPQPSQPSQPSRVRVFLARNGTERPTAEAFAEAHCLERAQGAAGWAGAEMRGVAHMPPMAMGPGGPSGVGGGSAQSAQMHAARQVLDRFRDGARGVTPESSTVLDLTAVLSRARDLDTFIEFNALLMPESGEGWGWEMPR